MRVDRILAGLLLTWLLMSPGVIGQGSSAKPFGATSSSFQQDVLVIDPVGKGRGISAPSVSLPGGFRYQVRVKFLPEKPPKDRPEDFVRTVRLYEWRGRPGADCATVACWVAVADFSSERSAQEKIFDVRKDTQWLLALWSLPPRNPEGEAPPPVASCQEKSCWKIEDLQVGGEGGVLLERAASEQKTSVTVLQLRENRRP